MLEGSVEQVAKEVFERQVTEQGRRVASIDDATPPEAEPVTTDSSSDKGKGAASTCPATKNRSGSLGSLNSPLARIFGLQATAGVAHSASRSQSLPVTGAGDKNLENRLARIEEALQILVGEVVKSSPGVAKDDDVGGGSAMKTAEPLKDLSGRPEEL